MLRHWRNHVCQDAVVRLDALHKGMSMSNIVMIFTVLCIGLLVGAIVIVGVATAMAALEEQERKW